MLKNVIIILLLVLLYPRKIVHNIHTNQTGRIIRVEPTEVLVKSKGKRLYWSKYELKEWKW